MITSPPHLLHIYISIDRSTPWKWDSRSPSCINLGSELLGHQTYGTGIEVGDCSPSVVRSVSVKRPHHAA